MIAGPLVLLTYKRFNDVLDGATFGVASGVAFVGAQTLVTAADLFESGLRPVGDVVPWVVRLLVLGVALPVIAAGAIGGLGGALWLRYRAPVTDRGRLGPMGQPVIAFVIAAALMLVASAAELLLPDQLVPSSYARDRGHLAVVALLWLRRIIHVGLLQEAEEIPIGPAITCPECGKQTPLHTYCGHCGASLKALPRSRGGPQSPPAVVGGSRECPVPRSSRSRPTRPAAPAGAARHPWPPAAFRRGGAAAQARLAGPAGASWRCSRWCSWGRCASRRSWRMPRVAIATSRLPGPDASRALGSSRPSTRGRSAPANPSSSPDRPSVRGPRALHGRGARLLDSSSTRRSGRSTPSRRASWC